MPVLTSSQRKTLDDACIRGRRASEQAVRAALGSLAVTDERPPAHLSEDDRQLRWGLLAKSRQLGGESETLDLLIAECAYEQWHRLLFARFLAENNLLIHPEYRAPVTLEDCDELAESLGEPDGWTVAGRFAAKILPGIFRLDDPCMQLRLAPEGRLELEGIVAGLPNEIFAADDALGWVYQYWQKERKDEINRSERKIGGADLGPVTQLFTENYMVRFLLENSLGAWWAARHPDSPLVKEWRYLRLDDNGDPAAGSFDSWPETVAEVTVMDPCCGSGHFLVEAFEMLRRMRAEEEDLDPVTAQDAVLRDNLFGLELDPRCVQIAMFALALAAWKAGHGWRELPMPHVACSGIPANAPVEEWTALAGEDRQLENALVRLHILFREADTLGSLIDPKRAVEISDPTGLQYSFDDVNWDDIAPLLTKALSSEADDPATAVLGADVAGIARAADYLSRCYTLVATNVPFLGMNRQIPRLFEVLERSFVNAKADLATAFTERSLRMASEGAAAVVLPQNWLYLASYKKFRESLLQMHALLMLAKLGSGAFSSISGEVVQPVLAIIGSRITRDARSSCLDVSDAAGVDSKAAGLRRTPVRSVAQALFGRMPDSRIVPELELEHPLLEEWATAYWGIGTGDGERFQRFFWEVPPEPRVWSRLHRTFSETEPYRGLSGIIRWEGGSGPIQRESTELGNRPTRGSEAWGRRGVAINQTGNLAASLYLGDVYQNGVAAVIPKRADILPALWAFCQSQEYRDAVRLIDPKIAVTNATLVRVPFDVDRWSKIAMEAGPLPSPASGDPTQWLFDGRPATATDPLQVGLGRLLGYRWPEQPESDDLDVLADGDGIVCLPSVRGERSAAERLQELLARAFGGTWSPARTVELIAQSGSKKKGLDLWLRDDFFKAHCQVFKNRPFIWQIWDGRKDGFSALVNYHKLGRLALEKLTYSYLGDWIERQSAGVRDDLAGAEERLAAARALQAKLELILEGEPPYDIYVRWKALAKQPIGWEPDLKDGVRLNVRPFVEAGVLRSKFNVKWNTDRGKNPDGSERRNDLHFTNAEKRAAREESV